MVAEAYSCTAIYFYTLPVGISGVARLLATVASFLVFIGMGVHSYRPEDLDLIAGERR